MPKMTLTEQDQALLLLLPQRKAGAVLHRLMGKPCTLDPAAETAFLDISGRAEERERGLRRDRERKRDIKGRKSPGSPAGNPPESQRRPPPLSSPPPLSPAPPISTPPIIPPASSATAPGGEEGLARVMRLYLDRVNPAPSPLCLELLASYADTLSPEVVEAAICEAIDGGKASWAYIKAILRKKQALGVRCAEDLNRMEAERADSRLRGDEAAPRKQYKTVVIDGEEVDVEVRGNAR